MSRRAVNALLSAKADRTGEVSNPGSTIADSRTSFDVDTGITRSAAAANTTRVRSRSRPGRSAQANTAQAPSSTQARGANQAGTSRAPRVQASTAQVALFDAGIDHIRTTRPDLAPGQMLHLLSPTRENIPWSQARPKVEIGTCIICLYKGHRAYSCKQVVSKPANDARRELIRLFNEGRAQHSQHAQ